MGHSDHTSYARFPRPLARPLPPAPRPAQLSADKP
jgi:hypothetical protein